MSDNGDKVRIEHLEADVKETRLAVKEVQIQLREFRAEQIKEQAERTAANKAWRWLVHIIWASVTAIVAFYRDIIPIGK